MVTGAYGEDLEFACNLADAAEVITRARFGAADLRVEAKPDMTPVSDADRAVEESLRERSDICAPADAISGEEFGSSGDGPRRWVIDPIDGTKNYVRGVPVWATLIALLDDDEPVVGVVSAPGARAALVGRPGHGAWTTALGASRRATVGLAGGRVEDASLSYSSLCGWACPARGRFVALTSGCWRTRAYGDFWSYMLVAEGAVDLAAEPELVAVGHGRAGARRHRGGRAGSPGWTAPTACTAQTPRRATGCCTTR